MTSVVYKKAFETKRRGRTLHQKTKTQKTHSRVPTQGHNYKIKPKKI